MAQRRRIAWVIAVEIAACGLLAWAAVQVASGGLPADAATAVVPEPTLARSSAAMAAGSSPSATAPPTATPAPSVTPTPAPPRVPVVVSADGDRLRLRQSPGTAGLILALLSAGSPLTAVGRTVDSAWLEVDTPDGNHGWVLARYTETSAAVDELPVTGQAVNDYTAGYPSYVRNITQRARELFLAGQAMGNHANAFSLVGDSNTDNPAFLAPFDRGRYDLGPLGSLEATVEFFRGSFGRDSPAAVGSFTTAKVLNPAYADSRCAASESPLACEYRLQRPSLALILLGTGDHQAWQTFEGRYRAIVEYTIAQGIIPVLITKADDLESKEYGAPEGYINSVIARLSQEYQVPLLDLKSAVDPLPQRGLMADGFHYSVPPDGLSGYFTGSHLDYGFTMRNLTALQMLDALRVGIILDGR